MRLWLAFCVVVMGAGQGLAQDADCTKAVVQSELTACAGQEFDAADADLNAAYSVAVEKMKAVDSALPEGERGALDALRSAQRAWISFRDAACDAEGYQFHGGSAEPMVVFGCRTLLTRDRIAGLEALLPEN